MKVNLVANDACYEFSVTQDDHKELLDFVANRFRRWADRDDVTGTRTVVDTTGVTIHVVFTNGATLCIATFEPDDKTISNIQLLQKILLDNHINPR